MKIFTGNQIKELDNATIKREPIESLALMERASEVIAQAICNRLAVGSELLFLIGKGNNGGDGLAVARMLANVGYKCSVYMAFGKEELSPECLFNLNRLPAVVTRVTKRDLYVILSVAYLTIVDCLYGSGIKGEIKGELLDLFTTVNKGGCNVISIDLPSGMKTELDNDIDKIIYADLTLTIEFPKLAMLTPKAGECCGEIEVLGIDLDCKFKAEEKTNYHYIDDHFVRKIAKKREKFSHKGDYGHALLICGSEGMIGASVLATCAALRSGCGLVTAHIPQVFANVMHASAPSAMLSLDSSTIFSETPTNLQAYSSIGVGCGLGVNEKTIKAFKLLLTSVNKPIVIDADALNILAMDQSLLKLVPEGSILTPHIGELRRLIGDWSNEQDKLEKIAELARRLSSIIVVKGAHSMVVTPSGEYYFNSTGNPGMAKGGSGDVLTGLLTGLLARGYDSFKTATLGVYMHGKAGDKAAQFYNVESFNSTDMLDFISDAFTDLYSEE